MKKRPTIGLLTKSLIEARRSPAWEEMVNFAREQDFNLLILVGGMLKSPIGFETSANILYDFVNASNVDGLIVTGGLGHYIGPASLQKFCERFRPLPLVSLEFLLDGFPSIIPDFYTGMRSLMKHLIEVHGHKRIAFIRGASDSKTGEDRYRAYLDSLAHHGLSVDLNLVAPGNFFPPSGADAVRLLLDERRATFDALVAANDDMAIDAMQVLQTRGIRVPDDVAITGFDNLEIARSMLPQLTTVELPSQKEVHLAAEMLLALLRGDSVPERLEIQMEVVLRQSCGCQSLAMSQVEALLPGIKFPAAQGDLALVEKEQTGDWLKALEVSRPYILREMVKACVPPPSPEDNALVTELWDSFVHDLQNPQESVFVPVLEKLIRLPSTAEINPSAWQGVLSVHRRATRPLLNNVEVIQQAENLWQRGRVFLAEMALNLEAQQQFHSNQMDETLRSVGESLITTFDIARLMDTVVRELPRMHIPACYIALYQGKDPSSEFSRLVLAYNKNGRMGLGPEGLIYPTREILPAGIIPAEQRFCHLVFPLHFHRDQLGFVVFEVGPRDGVIYETLSLQLSSALKGALLVNEAVQAREVALKAQVLAEKADGLKTRLLANVTHELRTPLNVILGYSRMALNEPNPYQLELPAGLRKDLENIHGSGEHLGRLINDLLDLSRAEIGELDLFPEPVAPRTFLEQAFHTLADSIRPIPGVSWKLDLPARLPVIQADPTRLRQIVLNLLSNANKFTEAGEIVLGAEVVPPHLHLWVKDTGQGIPIDRQERVFEPFFTESLANKRLEGIGLGLTITRRLVALHGGSLTLESQPGQGSIFHVYLPLPNLSGRQLPPPSQEAGIRPSLLLISAQENPLPEVAELAKRAHWDLHRVASQAQLKAVLNLSHPAALTWDLAHARPGDWAMIQQIRSHPQLSQIPFILYRQEGVGDETTAVRMTNILMKPLSSQTLADLIQSLQPTAAGGSVLIVDDDPQAREVYDRLISEKLPGYPVVLAEDGSVALDWLERETPSLVILDLTMPNVDGFTVLEHLRANPRTRMAPVFVLTGRLLSYEDIQRLDHSQVILHFKQILSDEEIIANIQRAFSGVDRIPQPTSQVVKQALVYLLQNYMHTLSRSEISAAVGVSDDYLSRIFNKEMGLSPWEYLNRYRVLQARRLLRETQESITWIAAQVGYEDPAYFSRVFQKLAGCSPREYRAQQAL
jgi:signal transduction histidine kinase/DNA-binding LacI/PurR family transcriptional regulator/AraC-like DNA-binding protein